MDFFVVFSGAWCATAPKSWLNEAEKTISWPNKKVNAILASQKGIVPKSDWEILKYTKLLGPYDYDTARAVEIASIDMATIDETHLKNSYPEKTKRSRKRPARFQDGTSSSGDDAGHSEDGKDTSKRRALPNNIDNTITPEEHLIKVEIEDFDFKPFTDDDLVIKVGATSPNKPVVSNSEVDQIPELHKIVFDKVPTDSQPVEGSEASHQESNNSTSHNCCPGCCAQIKVMSRKLDKLLNLMLTNYNAQERTPNILPNFPITTLEELQYFNEQLTDCHHTRAQYENFITQRSIPDGKKTIRVILALLLSDELCCKLSWSGQKKTIKVENMAFIKYLREAVILSNSRTSYEDCKHAVMLWLQHANDRIRIRGEKLKNK